MLRYAYTVWIGVLLASAGSAFGQECSTDAECPNEVCRRGVCDDGSCGFVRVMGCCRNDGDCPADNPSLCQDNYCDLMDTGNPLDNVCAVRTIAGCCVTDNDCPAPPDVCTEIVCVVNKCNPQPIDGCCLEDADCPSDPSPCIKTFCDTQTNTCDALQVPGCCTQDSDCLPSELECTESYCEMEVGEPNECEVRPIEGCRVSASQKGSLLMYSKVELRWAAGPAGALRQDTVLELTNDYPDDVCVQLYFVNGDEPLDPVLDPVTGGVIVEGEPGWEWVDCQFCLTPDQPTYWSAATGLPAGCQPFSILDPNTGMGPGRPDPNNPSERHLRGFVYAWAVDQEGYAIKWNHLSGGATLINYFNADAWEYNAWAFQGHGHCVLECDDDERCENPEWECEELPHGERIGQPGRLRLDGVAYDSGFDLLLMDFFATGSRALEDGHPVVTVDTDLTLHPITADLRQDTIGPVTTKAEFAIWNEDERRFSGTTRCITCWDQTLLSLYANPNHFLMANLQADKGKARIDGVESIVCDLNCVRNQYNHGSLDIDFILDILGIDHVCSYDASLLGVVAKELSFSGAATGRATAGRNLVGMGTEDGWIKWDIIAPPGSAYQGMAGLRSDRNVVKSPSTVRSQPDVGHPVDPANVPAE